METRELICIGCPLGCPLTVTVENNEVTITVDKVTEEQFIITNDKSR